MTSSTSSSEMPLGEAWRRWLCIFLGVLVTAWGAVCGFLLLVDPYDTGRFPSLGIAGIVDESPRTANASRARNEMFDSAVFGNSTGQLLDPRRLSRATGLSFAQLTVPGTGPREQLALLRYFMSRHRRIGAVVIVADQSWCTQDPALPIEHPFPFWLYGSWWEYLSHLPRPHAFDMAWRRIRLALGWRRPTDPAGYWDYENGTDQGLHPEPGQRSSSMEAGGAASEFSFPGIDKLGQALGEIAQNVPVVLAMPPAFVEAIPPPGSQADSLLKTCKSALQKLVVTRAGSGFLDFKLDSALTRDLRNFIDLVHYRAGVARYMEDRIAAIIRQHQVGEF